jgi:hypothetical protein
MTRFFFLLGLLLGPGSLAFGDFIESTEQQSGVLVNSTTTRAFYLGRLFETQDASNIQSFTGISAVAVLGQGPNVKLYAGAQSVPANVDAAITSSNLLYTGITFTTTNSSSAATYVAGGSNGIPLEPNTGTTLRNMLSTNAGLDFWLVENNPSSFTAPSGSTGLLGNVTPNNYSIRLQYTAVPEPSSLALVILTGAAAVGFARRRVVNRKRTTES